jgi:hypothetical protein
LRHAALVQLSQTLQLEDLFQAYREAAFRAERRNMQMTIG